MTEQVTYQGHVELVQLEGELPAEIFEIVNTPHFPVLVEDGPTWRTPSIASWLIVATEELGYDPTAPPQRQLVDARERLTAAITRIQSNRLTSVMLEPWYDVAAEDAAAYDAIAAEHWPSE